MLTNPFVSLLVGSYQQQRDQYRAFAEKVKELVHRVMTSRNVKCIVTSREKSPDSLATKLGKEMELNEGSFQKNGDGILLLSPPLDDLAGVRVLLYDPGDLSDSVSQIKRFLQINRETKEFPNKEGKKYTAFHLHFQAKDYPEEFSFLQKFMGDAFCEIQMCSVTQHIWNELEHDIKYKQDADGRPDAAQSELLDSLFEELQLVSKTIVRLMKKTEENIARNQKIILDSQALAYYCQSRFGEIKGDFGSLWSLLSLLEKSISPQKLDSLFDKAKRSLSEETAKKLASMYDLDKNYQDTAWIAILFLEAYGRERVAKLLEGNNSTSSPFLKMIQRYLKSHEGRVL